MTLAALRCSCSWPCGSCLLRSWYFYCGGFGGAVCQRRRAVVFSGDYNGCVIPSKISCLWHGNLVRNLLFVTHHSTLVRLWIGKNAERVVVDWRSGFSEFQQQTFKSGALRTHSKTLARWSCSCAQWTRQFGGGSPGPDDRRQQRDGTTFGFFWLWGRARRRVLREGLCLWPCRFSWAAPGP
jgi:hypothetical protein